MKQLWRFVAWLACIAVVIALATPFLSTSLPNKPGEKQAKSGRGKGGKEGEPEGPTPVLTAKARKADVPIYVEGVGTGRALNSVLVRSQVDGILTKLNFTEGQDVKAGDLIAQIDPRLYQAVVDQNVAKKAQDASTLENAKRDLERYRMLAASKAATQQQYDTQKATVATNEALVKLDQALIDSAKTTLSYTNITTPISGRVGIRNVDVGNLIHASDTTGIVTISQIRPMSVIFNLPQQELPRVNKASLAHQLDVQALDSNGLSVVDHGTLAAVDNTIDATTGTVKLRANFPNQQLQLWPGIFVNVRLLVETLQDAIVIPVAALQRGPKGPFVFVAAGDKAVMRLVTPGQQDDTQAVVAAGLSAGETIITSGFQKLTDGGKIKTTEEATPPTDKAPALHQQGVSPVEPARPRGAQRGNSRPGRQSSIQ